MNRKATCPYCGFDACEADWVDVDVGMIQCGPFLCDQCGASEVGPYDTNPLDADEKRTKWFKNGHIGSGANSFKGQHVDAETAKRLYRAGLTINDHRLTTQPASLTVPAHEQPSSQAEGHEQR